MFKLLIASQFMWLVYATSLAQELPHRMRVGLSADVLGATFGIGAQLHGSLRITDDYRAYNDRHHYINFGIGTGAGFTGGSGMIGRTVPHYLTYGIGKGRAMIEFGYAGIGTEKQMIELISTPNGIFRDRRTKWSYVPAPIVGYRYTAYSGFMVRLHLVMVLPGISIGWIF